MGILEKISEIEKEISRTQKNKGLIYWIYFDLTFNITIFLATEYHLGLLKAKLAKYRSQLLEPSKKSEKGEGFDVLKSGDARIALIGFPSVGKVIVSLFKISKNKIKCLLNTIKYILVYTFININ